MLNHKTFGSAFESLPKAVFIIKFSIKHAYIVYANTVLEKLVGYHLSDIQDKDLIELFLSKTSNSTDEIEKLQQAFLSQKPQEQTLQFNNKDNIPFHGKLTLSPMQGEEPNLYVVTLEDVSSVVLLQKQLHDSKQKHEVTRVKLNQLSKTDSLTGVYNPKAINHELSILFNSAKRNYGSFSILFIEVDCLEEISAKHGKESIDKCIGQFAKTLTHNFRRKSDIIIRYSHEQFLVCFAGANESQTFGLADKILQSVQNTPVILSTTQTLNLTVSIGMINTVLNLESNLDHTIGVTHMAVNTAKRKGGNQVSNATDDI